MGHRSVALKLGYTNKKRWTWGTAESGGSAPGFVKKVINPSCGFGADAWNLAQIGNRGPLDRLEGAEMAQKRPFAGGSDAGDLLQPGFADVAAAALAVRPDGEPVRFVAQALDEI